MNGFPLFPILGTIFIVLKLTGYIAWSWWWVTAPFWGPFAVFAVLFVLLLPFGITKALRDNRNQKAASDDIANRLRASYRTFN